MTEMFVPMLMTQFTIIVISNECEKSLSKMSAIFLFSVQKDIIIGLV